jgi:nicotinate-nucleotide--dimethylbenzimidazole phosphoribosyltransferase
MTAETDELLRIEPSDAPARVFDAIYSLRATRIYHDRPVPPEVLDQILQAGTMACSSGNTQPWEFVVVTDPALKARIKVEMQIGFADIDAERSQRPEQLVDGVGRPITGHAAVEHLDTVPAIVVVCWNPERGVRFKGEYVENPDGSLTAVREIPGGRGVSLFQSTQNMMLAAQALGVSSLFTTFFFLRQEQIKEILGIPKRIFMECAVFFGYADEQLGRPRRRPVPEVTHLNGWGNRYRLTSTEGDAR